MPLVFNITIYDYILFDSKVFMQQFVINTLTMDLSKFLTLWFRELNIPVPVHYVDGRDPGYI